MFKQLINISFNLTYKIDKLMLHDLDFYNKKKMYKIIFQSVI